MEQSQAVRRAASLLVTEGAALALLGVVAAAVADQDDRAAGLATAAFAVLGGGLLALLARALTRGRGWARTPAIVLQLLAFPVGTDQLRGGAYVAGAVVLLVAGATLFHLVAVRQD